jgi:muramoyltetrapeptide carboxypeptidase
VVVGGNLSVLYSLLGTPYFPDVRGCVLLLEDLDEYLYHLDRMLLAFRLAGIWEQVAGVAVGSFTDIRDNTRAFGQSVDNPFGRSVQEIFEDQIRPQHPDLPIVWDLPVGHGPVNRPVVLGCGGWILAKFAQNTTDVRSISGSFENPAEGD